MNPKHLYSSDDEDDSDEGIYSEEGREELIDKEDEITDTDEGFMQGYDEGEKLAMCALCKTILEDNFVEREIDGEIYRFCSDKHAEIYIKNHAE